MGGGETGIDIVALTHEGDYWAVQCKCYQKDTLIDKPAVDSFLSTSGREFKNENLQTTRFAHRLWISTTNNWGPNATEAIRNQNPPVIRINLSDLLQAPVDWAKLEAGIHGEASRTLKKTLEDKSEIQETMESVEGIADLAVYTKLGQPNLLVEIDRKRAARYGVLTKDVNKIVQAAVGGEAVTQRLDGDRRFDVVVRTLPQFRSTQEEIKNIPVATGTGYIPLKEVAEVYTQSGASFI